MIEITGITILISFFILLVDYINNLNIILLSIIFFPFLFKDKIGYLFYLNFKEVYLFLVSILLYLYFLLPLANKKKLLKYFYILNFILVFVPIANFLFHFEEIIFSSIFISDFLKSFLIPIAFSTIFFTIIIYFNKENLEKLFKKFYFILIIIFLNF